MSRIPVIARKVGLDIPDNWKGVDAVIPLIDKIREDGAVFLIKFDGERSGEDDAGQFTTVVTGTPLGGGAIRIDTSSLEEALAYAIVRYAEQVWVSTDFRA